MAVLSRLANLVAKQIPTPAAPPAGSNVLYPKADDNWYTQSSAGIEEQFLVTGSVRVATAIGITLSGTQTIDGIALVVGDRVLVRHQGVFTGNAVDNGVWVVQSGAWTRATDANTSAKLAGARFLVTAGAQYEGWIMECAYSSAMVLGTDPVAFVTVNRQEEGNVYQRPYANSMCEGASYNNTITRTRSVFDGSAWAEQKGIQNYGSTAPGSPITGEIWIDSSVNTSGTADVWSTYTPTWGSTISLGNGTSTGRYIRMGNTVHFWARATLGSTSTMTGSGAITFYVPVGNARSLGPVTASFLSSGQTYYTAHVMTGEFNGGTNALTVYATGGANGSIAMISATYPFTWKANDNITVNATYEVA